MVLHVRHVGNPYSGITVIDRLSVRLFSGFFSVLEIFIEKETGNFASIIEDLFLKF